MYLYPFTEPDSSFAANFDDSGQDLVGGRQLCVVFQSDIVVLLLLIPELGDGLHQLPVLLVGGVGQGPDLVVVVLGNTGL